MHAIVCDTHGDPGVMEYREIADPMPAAKEGVIAAEAIGVNYVDTMRRSGNHPAAPKPPFIPGIEVCGRVSAVGPDVSRFSVGDRVIGRCVTNGAYAEQVCVEERFTVACPESLSAEQGAALFVNGQTAYHALQTVGRLQPGEFVLITAAAGGVGTCAVQIAKLLGGRVIAAAGTEAKRELAKRLGAEFLIGYRESGWPQKVLDVTGGSGASLIIESVGGDIARGCLQCWAPGGRIVIYGKASGEPAVITGNELLFGNRTAYGLAVGTVIEDEDVMRSAMDRLVQWVESGDLELQIGATYSLKDAAQAHRDLVSRKTSSKLVLLP